MQMSTTQEKAFDDRVGKVTIAEQLRLANLSCGDIGNTYITPTFLKVVVLDLEDNTIHSYIYILKKGAYYRRFFYCKGDNLCQH